VARKVSGVLLVWAFLDARHAELLGDMIEFACIYFLLFSECKAIVIPMAQK